MAKYHLHLKGYVGSSDFNSRAVDRCLKENASDDVRVLIDSTGGELRTGLSIAAAFRNHGAVDVHFVGLNASAATVASLGARTISMDRNAMYLVHKCSNFVFAFQSMNADELEGYICGLIKNKIDLDKIDDNIAAMYAARCRKDKGELLALMQAGGWLSAKEALEWGFVDKITDNDGDAQTVITNCLASDLKAAGIPVPGAVEEGRDFVSKILTSVRDFFKGEPQAVTETHETPEAVGKTAPAEENEAEALPEAGTDNDLKALVPEAEAEPEAESAGTAAKAVTKEVLDTAGVSTSADSFGRFIDAGVSARKLFNSLP